LLIETKYWKRLEVSPFTLCVVQG